MAEILSLVLKRNLNLSELYIMHLSRHFPWGCPWGAPPNSSKENRSLCSLQSHDLLNAKKLWVAT